MKGAFFFTYKMKLTDTHTHIYYQAESPELALQMERCLASGIDRLFLPNVDLKSVDLITKTVAAYPDNCFPMLGLHPCSVHNDFNSVLTELKKSIDNTNIYAIGEIGLDLHWDKSTLHFQQEAFRIQVQWAKDLDLPIII